MLDSTLILNVSFYGHENYLIPQLDPPSLGLPRYIYKFRLVRAKVDLRYDWFRKVDDGIEINDSIYNTLLMNSERDTFYPDHTVLRLDDISVNVQKDRLVKFLRQARSVAPGIEILLAFSPLVFDMETHEPERPAMSERVFPKILNAYSDHRAYYEVQKLGLPPWLPEVIDDFRCTKASHGLIHVDHRLLNKQTQELSILTSASLVNSKIFVPPFNKYNSDTLEIVAEHNLTIVKWEDGWQHLGYNRFADDGNKYYVHMHDYPGDEILRLLE